MVNLLVNFQSGINRLPSDLRASYRGNYDECPGIITLMNPIDGALAAFRVLCELFDTYMLSTAPWQNPSAWSDKDKWVQVHLGDVAQNRLILSYHKDKNRGHFLIVDRPTTVPTISKAKSSNSAPNTTPTGMCPATRVGLRCSPIYAPVLHPGNQVVWHIDKEAFGCIGAVCVADIIPRKSHGGGAVTVAVGIAGHQVDKTMLEERGAVGFVHCAGRHLKEHAGFADMLERLEVALVVEVAFRMR